MVLYGRRLTSEDQTALRRDNVILRQLIKHGISLRGESATGHAAAAARRTPGGWNGPRRMLVFDIKFQLWSEAYGT